MRVSSCGLNEIYISRNLQQRTNLSFLQYRHRTLLQLRHHLLQTILTMAQKSHSVEDIKLQTENIEYAEDLKRVDSADGAAPTVIVTEEDVSAGQSSMASR